ncbi:hypothetical protein DPMN_060648 [Dreissena polymorpha]|uniref:Uncharacterized protein n=1 Tax=Dreissena polymorpha TaxID=45954 RepID=A0A9D4C5L8_DREPO|nr:hypothetical protein DPMN_060648 [Dreissena polymorpha]
MKLCANAYKLVFPECGSFVLPSKQDVKIQLTKVSEGGRIGARGMFTLSILANDNPHGSVQLAQTQYSVSELDTNSLQNIRVTRS